MADLRSRFIEDYAGGLLNVSRQELSTTGEVLSQDGFTSEGTIFVEDGSGTKSGLKLGVSIAEVIDPITEEGVVNVRYADRTYAKVRDLRIFTTAISSAQAALSEATSISLSNVETTLQLLEDDVRTLDQNVQTNLDASNQQIQQLTAGQRSISDTIAAHDVEIKQLDSRLTSLENPTGAPPDIVIEDLDTLSNTIYYPGTITITAGAVVGVGTSFTGTFAIGSTFVARTSTGEEVEYTVRSFNTTDPDQNMAVTPTNKNVPAGSLYQRDRFLSLKKKINEILYALKRSNIIV